MGAQYAIMRFAKYKGPEISGIEAHNERTKEKYASNPDVDSKRSIDPVWKNPSLPGKLLTGRKYE